MSHNKGSSPCCLIAGLIGFGFFSLLWDIAADAWGLGHGQVLAIFFGIALVMAMLGAWVVEDGWPSLMGWLAQRRRARRDRDR
jgi:hypothetical protein